MKEISCDLAVVGSGPGGYVAAARAAQLGLRTVLIEKDERLGGTCVLRGCVPTKALLHAAEVWRLCRKEAAVFGIEVAGARLDWAKVRRRQEGAVTKSSKGVEHLLQTRGVEVVRGHGRLREPGRLEVDGPAGERTLVTAPRVVLAAGSQPAALPGIEVDGERVLFSDHLLRGEAVPESLIILGAGAVGAEFADLMSAFGCRVTLVELLPRVLPLEDPDCSEVVARALHRRGVKVLTGRRAVQVETLPGGVRVRLEAAGGTGGAGGAGVGPTAGAAAPAGAETLEAERLLVAAGRRPASADLGLENTAARPDRRGFVAVDGAQRTDQPGLWAIGDLVPTQQLAHLASREGLVAVADAAGRPLPPIVYDLVPSCVYTSPEVASVGLTVEEATRRGHRARAGSYPFAALAKASILGEPHGLARVVLDEADGRVLGVHLAGPRVTELIAGAAAALGLGGAVAEDWASVIHPHPTLSEAVGEALLAALGRPLHGG